MRLTAASLPGVHTVEQERVTDSRGWFARTFDRDVLVGAGLVGDFPQHSASWNAQRGTVRGLHWQRAPHEEAKIVRCTHGRVFDVVVDVRAGSPTFGRWESFDLSAEDGRAVYIPAGFAHGFQTLTDATELHYLISAPYEPAAAAGARWDDPALAITWPLPVTSISERDASLPVLADG
jgi:dTDP-4-dehydrorhamnose 3,5-epimerase